MGRSLWFPPAERRRHGCCRNQACTQMCTHTAFSHRSPGPWRGSPCPSVADEPSLHLGPGPRADDRARRASRKQICRWLWDQEPSAGVGMPSGPQKGACQHVYFGEGVLGGLLTENCLETADEILFVYLYGTMSSEKTGTHGTHFIITSTQPRGGMPLMVSRCFVVKGKWAMKAISRKGVGSGGHGWFLGLVPWQWDGGTPPTR